jgi:hypothetical protein
MTLSKAEITPLATRRTKGKSGVLRLLRKGRSGTVGTVTDNSHAWRFALEDRLMTYPFSARQPLKYYGEAPVVRVK